MVKIVCKIINLSLPNLACFAPWRESIPAFEYFRLPENLRELRKIFNYCNTEFAEDFCMQILRSLPAWLHGEFQQRKF